MTDDDYGYPEIKTYLEPTGDWSQVVGRISGLDRTYVPVRTTKRPAGRFVPGHGRNNAIVFAAPKFEPEMVGAPRMLRLSGGKARPVIVVLPGPRSLSLPVCPDPACYAPLRLVRLFRGANKVPDFVRMEHTRFCSFKDLSAAEFNRIVAAHESLLALGEEV